MQTWCHTKFNIWCIFQVKWFFFAFYFGGFCWSDAYSHISPCRSWKRQASTRPWIQQNDISWYVCSKHFISEQKYVTLYSKLVGSNPTRMIGYFYTFTRIRTINTSIKPQFLWFQYINSQKYPLQTALILLVCIRSYLIRVSAWSPASVIKSFRVFHETLLRSKIMYSKHAMIFLFHNFQHIRCTQDQI